MLETPQNGPSVDNRLLKLSSRLIKARQSEAGSSLPDRLMTDSVVAGLIDITTVSEYDLPQMPRQESETLKRGAVAAIRTLIAGLMQGGLPAQKAYDFFTMEDLNLLFYVHGRLSGAEQYPDIPLVTLPKVGGHDH